MDNARIWLKMAEEDLLWAKASLREEILRGACFAAQQSAEKALKAFLLSNDQALPKIHDLVALDESCIRLDNEFEGLIEACNLLSPFYLSTRYPDVAQFEEYTTEMTKTAIDQAEKIINLVKQKVV